MCPKQRHQYVKTTLNIMQPLQAPTCYPLLQESKFPVSSFSQRLCGRRREVLKVKQKTHSVKGQWQWIHTVKTSRKISVQREVVEQALGPSSPRLQVLRPRLKTKIPPGSLVALLPWPCENPYFLQKCKGHSRRPYAMCLPCSEKCI